MCARLLAENGMHVPEQTGGRVFRAADGAVGGLPEAGQCGEWEVHVRAGTSVGRLRLCGIRKSEYGIQRALAQLLRQAGKQGHTPKPETLEYAQYVLVVSNLPSAEFSAQEVLEWYRLRWQIELVFKRLKSLAGLGHLAKHDEPSVRSWLYGKLLVGLLTQKLIRTGRDISPWGYSFPTPSDPPPVAGVQFGAASTAPSYRSTAGAGGDDGELEHAGRRSR